MTDTIGLPGVRHVCCVETGSWRTDSVKVRMFMWFSGEAAWLKVFGRMQVNDLACIKDQQPVLWYVSAIGGVCEAVYMDPLSR